MRKFMNIVESAASTLVYERDGFPREMHNEAEVQEAIAAGFVTPDTPITVYQRGVERPTMMKASRVPEIAKHFPSAQSDHSPPPPASKRIHVTRALEIIHTADISNEIGAQHVLDALHSVCDSVLQWVENRGEVALAARKAVGEAKTYFPRDANALMSNPHALRNIRDGLGIIRQALQPYQVVMEAEQPTEDWYDRRDELESDMVFRDYQGDLVKLDRQVPGDATQWYVADFSNGSWAYYDSTIEPGDLVERVPDPTMEQGK